jgi:hypothetical protein
MRVSPDVLTFLVTAAASIKSQKVQPSKESLESRGLATSGMPFSTPKLYMPFFGRRRSMIFKITVRLGCRKYATLVRRAFKVMMNPFSERLVGLLQTNFQTPDCRSQVTFRRFDSLDFSQNNSNFGREKNDCL